MVFFTLLIMFACFFFLEIQSSLLITIYGRQSIFISRIMFLVMCLPINVNGSSTNMCSKMEKKYDSKRSFKKSGICGKRN